MSIYGTFTILYDADGDDVPETSIGADVVSNIVGDYGSFSNDATDFLANSGRASFDLDNSAGTYTNLKIGRRVDIKVSDGIYTKVVFSGKIAPSKIDPREWGDRQVHVTLDDWMRIASGNKIKNLQVAEDVTADVAMDMLIVPMARPPAHKNFAPGVENLPDVFDGVSKNSAVYGEMDRIAKSELAHCYLNFRRAAYGETLVLENQHSRGILTPLSTIPLNDASAGLLKFHDAAAASGRLKYHGAGGTSGFIKLSETQDAYFDRLHVDADWQRGDYLVNKFTATDVSRVTDGAPVVLFDFTGDGNALVSMGPGIPVEFNGTFTDPNQRNTQITAKNVITPVATTDYLFNSQADGLGADVTSSITIQTFHYGAGHWSVNLVSSANEAYCIKWQVRGTGIHKATNIDYEVENSQSIVDVVGEERGASIRREYSVNRNTSKTFADSKVALHRLPDNNMRNASFKVYSEFLMRAFMFLDIGDKVRIIEGTPAKDGMFYIQGIKFVLALGGLISFTWSLSESVETHTEPIIVAGPTAESINAIDYGVLPYLANLHAFSYSFWIRRDLDLVDTYFAIVSKTADLGSGRRGHEIITDGDGKIYFHSFKTPTDGEWVTNAVALVNADQWYHIAVTYDNTTDTANPVIYVDGTSVAITETGAPSGTSDDDSDCPLVLFNASPNPTNVGERYADATAGFSLKDVRIYDLILSSGNVTLLEAGEDDYTTVPTGLLFQGIYASTGFIEEFTADTILQDDFVLDAVHNAAGIPYNERTELDAYILHGEAIP